MHILLGLLGVIGVVAVWYWRAKMAAGAAREALDAADDARLFVRRSRWRNKSGKDVLATIQDPREAAAAMMVAVAQFDGEISQAEMTVIAALIRKHFEADDAFAQELLAQGRWLAKDAGDLGSYLRKASPAVAAQCTDAERRDLVAMLYAVAEADGGANATVTRDIDRFAEQLLA